MMGQRLDSNEEPAAVVMADLEIVDNEDEKLLEVSNGNSKSSGPAENNVDVWNLANSPVISLALWSMVAAGIQFGWALQLSLLTPYVQTLGIDHSFSSFIWLCGPVTGFVVQPCVGVWSDKCKSKWGRRRPFIFGGALLVCFSVILIGFSADIGYALGDTHEDCKNIQKAVLRPWAAGVFIFGFWLLDVANNTVQGPARALLADLAGSDQRNSANAIFCSWIAVGNVLGFATGAGGHWVRWFPFLKNKACCDACANLKAAFLLAVFFLVFCTGMTLHFSHEIPLLANEVEKRKNTYTPLSPEDRAGKELELSVMSGGGLRVEEGLPNGAAKQEQDDATTGPAAVLVNLLMGIRQLSPSMKSVLLVMTLTWLSWFPFFLFDTDWMGREVFGGDPAVLEKVHAYNKGVRAGAFGLLLNSIVLGVSSFLIDPLCRWVGSKSLWATSNFVVFVCMSATAVISASASRRGHGEQWVKDAALVLFAVLGFPLAVTYSVPFSVTAELTADTGGGQGLSMGILNLSVVIPQMVVALGAGPWDAVFGGGNEPAFALAAVFALLAGIVAVAWLPQLSKHGYQRSEMHGLA